MISSSGILTLGTLAMLVPFCVGALTISPSFNLIIVNMSMIFHQNFEELIYPQLSIHGRYALSIDSASLPPLMKTCNQSSVGA